MSSPEYQNAKKALHSIYLVVKNGNHDIRIKKLEIVRQAALKATSKRNVGLPSGHVKSESASPLQLVVHFVGGEPHLAQLKLKAFFCEQCQLSQLLLP